MPYTHESEPQGSTSGVPETYIPSGLKNVPTSEQDASFWKRVRTYITHGKKLHDSYKTRTSVNSVKYKISFTHNPSGNLGEPTHNQNGWITLDWNPTASGYDTNISNLIGFRICKTDALDIKYKFEEKKTGTLVFVPYDSKKTGSMWLKAKYTLISSTPDIAHYSIEPIDGSYNDKNDRIPLLPSAGLKGEEGPVHLYHIFFDDDSVPIESSSKSKLITSDKINEFLGQVRNAGSCPPGDYPMGVCCIHSNYEDCTDCGDPNCGNLTYCMGGISHCDCIGVGDVLNEPPYEGWIQWWNLPMCCPDEAGCPGGWNFPNCCFCPQDSAGCPGVPYGYPNEWGCCCKQGVCSPEPSGWGTPAGWTREYCEYVHEGVYHPYKTCNDITCPILTPHSPLIPETGTEQFPDLGDGNGFP